MNRLFFYFKTFCVKAIAIFAALFFMPIVSSATYGGNTLPIKPVNPIKPINTDTLSLKKLDSIIISSSNVGSKTPVAKSSLTRAELLSRPASHSLPMLLGLEPSVVATTEGGLGLGYSKFSVRGSDASRTNITLNGIAINDGESQEVFWVNMPSLSNSLQSVQLQRGVGTSSNGPGSFGATMNMLTKSSSAQSYATADFSFGSYSTYMTSLTAGTGELKSGADNRFSLDIALAHNKTKGYIRNAKANLNSLFLSGSWRNTNNLLRLIYIIGDQKTGITWEGCPIEIYPKDRRYNVAGEYKDDEGRIKYYDNETDNYTQHHLQLHYIRHISDYLNFKATLHYTKGDGYYQNYKYDTKFSKYGIENQIISGVVYKKSDFIIRQSMDNNYYAGLLNLNYQKGGLQINSGVNISYYDGDHFGNLLWSKYNANIPDNYSWYSNNGKKREASAFVKAEYELGEGFTAFADIQLRHIGFDLSGMDKDFVALDNKARYNFLNPKAGINYRINNNSRLYFSLSSAHREPSRSDIKESIKAGKTKELKSEAMLDYELGYQYSNGHFAASVNLYAMEYKNQLVATGRLTETGYVIQENIPKSYRRGIELALAWRPVQRFDIAANATISRNRLKNYTLFVDAYNNATDWLPVPQHKLFLKSSHLTLSPEFIAAAVATYSPMESAEIALRGKYVGEQYLDNSSMEVAKVPSYFVASLELSKAFRLTKREEGRGRLKASLCVDNLFNNRYYSYGWIYRAVFEDHSPDYVEKGVYSQAPIHFIAKLSLSF